MNETSSFKVMCLGDVVARTGRVLLKQRCQELRLKYEIDLVIVNAENASGGMGLDAKTLTEFENIGVDIVTLGDHTWQRRELRPVLSDSPSAFCIRPANYPKGAPGTGWTKWESSRGFSVGVLNLLGRVFMNAPLDCPYKAAREILEGPLADCAITICDFHAEATSEKIAMGRYLDGKLSLLFGTHTHVPTADYQILSRGTGYITDLGMCGSTDGVIGLSTDVALERLVRGLPKSYKAAKGQGVLNGIVATIDANTSHTIEIERIAEA